MSTIDQQFVEYIVKSLVSNPDKVEVKRSIDEKGVLLELTVDPSDLGRVIGKRGMGAQALRTLLRALGTKNDARYNLKIVDNGEPRPERETSGASKEQKTDHTETADESQAAASEEVATEEADDDHDSIATKTRRELAELDDLDI